MNVGAASMLIYWDYDTQWGGDRSRTGGGAKDWGYLEFENTERLLELHAEYQVPACFAVVGAAALPGERPYHDPAQIKRIHDAGHEVASHTFHHDWLPGLGRNELRETLRLSKDALEQCIGAPVVSFVPPYNQPFDYSDALAYSFSERREAGRTRTNLGMLCEALRETGYRFSRVSYKTLGERAKELITRKKLERPAKIEEIHGLRVVRMNATGGFNQAAHRILDMCVAEGGFVVVGGHPHSLHAGNSQDEINLVPFLQHAHELHKQGRLRLLLPRDLIGESVS